LRDFQRTFLLIPAFAYRKMEHQLLLAKPTRGCQDSWLRKRQLFRRAPETPKLHIDALSSHHCLLHWFREELCFSRKK